MRYPMEREPRGRFSRPTLRALLPLLDAKPDRGGGSTIEANVSDWWQLLEERAMQGADPINPQRVFWELSRQLPDDAILTCDSGSAANWFARDLNPRGA